MKKIIITALLVYIAGCSTTKIETEPLNSNDCNEIQKNETKPIDGGLGGTGVLPQQECTQSFAT